MRRLRTALIAAVVLLGVAQLVPAHRDNPPVTSDLDAPAKVKSILRRACYDCHSNETRWPFYSGIAPVSWWVRYHVAEGRRRLNFSEWADYSSDPGTEAQKLEEISRLVRKGAMPPWYYRLAHPSARLSEADCEVIVRWVVHENRRAAPSG